MSADPTLPLPGAGAPGEFPPPTDPWSTPVPPSQAPEQPAPELASATPVPAPPPTSGPPAPVAVPAAGPVAVPAAGPVAVPAAGPMLVQIGEIAVTSSTVRTPAGEIPLTGSIWQVADYWQSEQRTPRWAIVAAIVGFFVVTVFSLVFLLVKETVHRGTVQVTVSNGRWQYVALVPVTDQDEVQRIYQRVNYVRSLAMI